jgi:ABC-type branched-subunit amino acid transport system ATPase component
LSDLQKVQSDVSVKEKIAHYLTSNERFKKLTIDKKLLLAKEALKLLNTEVSSKLLMFSGMAFYLFLLISPFIVLFLTAPR